MLNLVLIFLSLLVWSGMFAFYWRKELVRWIDNRVDLDRFRKGRRKPPAGTGTEATKPD